MLFNERSLKSLKAIQGQPEARLRPELAGIAKGLNLGRVRGQHRIVCAEEIETLIAFAKKQTNWDFETEIRAGDRTDAATDNEKLGGRAAYDRMVMVRHWRDSGVSARIISVDALDRLEFNSVLMIENAAVMFHFHRLAVKWPAQISNPLILFRGDKQFSPKWVSGWLKVDARPVDAVPDLDPEGLAIAARYPRLRHLIVPGEGDLPARAQINHNRFLRQIARTGRECPRPDHPDISFWWRYLVKRESAIPQEAWLNA